MVKIISISILCSWHALLFYVKSSDATAFSNFNLDTNWDTYLCANVNPIVDEKSIILTATGLQSNNLPCVGLRKNLKISGEYEMSSQLINVAPQIGERNFGLAFNVEDEKNYDFVYLRFVISKYINCIKLNLKYD